MYEVNNDGTMFTVTPEGDAYKVVRDGKLVGQFHWNPNSLGGRIFTILSDQDMDQERFERIAHEAVTLITKEQR